jgi:isopentenyldiphosphate isomerase
MQSASTTCILANHIDALCKLDHVPEIILARCNLGLNANQLVIVRAQHLEFAKKWQNVLKDNKMLLKYVEETKDASHEDIQEAILEMANHIQDEEDESQMLMAQSRHNCSLVDHAKSISSSLKSPPENDGEYLEILSSSGDLTGKILPRSEVHRLGEWHAAVHIWIINKKTGQILLQQRAPCKDSFPSLWDVSCAGHVKVDEHIDSTAIAELSEELGLFVSLSSLDHICTLPREVFSQNDTFKNREIVSVYVLMGRWDLEYFELQKDEVSSVKYIDLETYIAHLKQEDETYVPFPDLERYERQVFNCIRQKIQEETIHHQ